MGKPKVTLYVDVVSPFAYIAYYITRHSEPFKSIDVSYVPILLGGVMSATGNQPPLNIKNKDKWITKERVTWSKYFKVPIADEVPEPFPQPTVNTQRALCAVQNDHPDRLIAALDALYHTFWVERKTINDPKVISASLEKALGADTAKAVMDAIKGDAAKKTLRQNSDRALADGAFGLPYFVATNAKGETDTFWGVDHLGVLLNFLGVEFRQHDTFRAVL